MLESTMLLISDDPTIVEAADEVVRAVEGLKLATLPRIDDAYSYESWEGVALVLIHLKARGQATGVARLLRMISAARRPVATLVLGEPYDAEQALMLLRLGVADYLRWPVDAPRLAYLVEILTIRSRRAGGGSNPNPNAIANPAGDVPRPSSTTATPPADPILDDESPETDRLMAQVRRVAPQDTTILLSGETGTGKTRLAHLIHELSPRRPEPFLVINCGALSASLIESEMFGHVRGAFTGAERDRVGKFAEVGRGTLFLDEIDTLPLTVQAKLLRVVEDRVFEAVGSNKSQPVRARLIAASNRALDQEVAAQRFRSDLYYRLNVIGFHLPPLRDRRGAISALVSRFIGEFAARNGSGVASIAADALAALERYDWPGNVRELRNTIERAVALCPGPEVRLDDLPEAVVRGGPCSGPEPATPLAAGQPRPQGQGREDAPPTVARSTLAQIKREAELARITEALEKHSNNRLRAAIELGISRMTLYKKLYKYGLIQPSHAGRPGQD